MIIVEKIESGFLSYSDMGLKIKPVFDRLGKEINNSAAYDVAEDIEINEMPRYDYEETDIPIDVEEA